MKLKIDILKENYQAIKIKQNTNVTFTVELFKNGEIYDVTGKTIALHCVNSNKNVLIQGDNISVNGNILTIKLMKDMTYIAGKMQLQIEIGYNSELEASFKIPFVVDERVNKMGVVVPSLVVDVMTSLSQKITEALGVKKDTEDLIKNGGAVTKGELNIVKSQLDETIIQVNGLNSTKVDKVAGKELSTNDYTHEDKLLVTKVNDKRDKSTPIDMADLTQAVKTAMTGGSVAVVGVNAVNTANLVNNAVTGNKIALDTIDVVNLYPTADIQLRFQGGSIESTLNNTDFSQTLVFTGCLIEMLKKNFTRHTSANINGTFVIPDNGRLVWRWQNADGSFGHTIEVLNKDQACINSNACILAQNFQGVIYGPLSEFISVNGWKLMNDSVRSDKLHYSANNSVRTNNVLKASFNNSTGDVTITPAIGQALYFYNNDGSSIGKAFPSNISYTIPYLGALVFDYKTTDIKVVPNNTVIDTKTNVILLKNNKFCILSGILSDNVTNNVDGAMIKDNTINIDKTDYTIDVDIRTNSVFDYSFNSTSGDVTLTTPGGGFGGYMFDNVGNNPKSFAINGNTSFVIPYLGSLVLDLVTNKVIVNPNGTILPSTRYVHLITNNKFGVLSGVLADRVKNGTLGAMITDRTIEQEKLTWDNDLVIKTNKPIIIEKDVDNRIAKFNETTIALYEQNGTLKASKVFSGDYVIPKQGCLYMDIDKKFELVVIKDGDILSSRMLHMLILNNAGILTGKLVPYCKISDDNSTQVTNALPAYWTTHIMDKVNVIKQLQNKDINSFSFAFSSDHHIDHSRGASKKIGDILYELDNQINLSKILFGGDYIDGATSQAEMIRDMILFTSLIGKVKNKCLLTTGNHEIVYKYDAGGTYAPQMWTKRHESYTLRKQFNTKDNNITYGEEPFDYVNDKGSIYFYSDDEVNKIRYISIDMYEKMTSHVQIVGILQAQLDWVTNIALDLKSKSNADDWKIIIFGHQPLNLQGVSKMPPIKNASLFMDIMDKFNLKQVCNTTCTHPDFQTRVNVDFSSYKGRILAFLCGHGHEDCNTFTNSGVPIIEITSDNYWTRASQNLEGTSDEHSIDIYTVVPNERKFYITKVGGSSTIPPTSQRQVEYNY